MSTTPPPPDSASPALLEEYAKWRAVGLGGVPANWDGFMFIKNAESQAFSDTLTPEVYDQPEKYVNKWDEASAPQRAAAQKPFLKEPLPTRAEPRARAKYFLIPQRERNADEPHDPVINEAYQSMFDKMADINEGTEWKTSVLEKRGKALFLKESVPISPIMQLNHREICHVHGSDLSGHVTLSFPDAKEVIAKGWGERHRLSGTERLPLGYTMVYVPRSVDEVDVFARIFQAGVEFMKSG